MVSTSRTVPVPLLWQTFSQTMPWPSALGEQLWRALVASADADARAMVFTVHRHTTSRQQSQGNRHLVLTLCRPTRLVALLERLHADGLLSRSQTTQAQEAVLRRTGPHGQWK